MRISPAVFALLTLGCNSETAILSMISTGEDAVLFSLDLDSPTYGEFTGDGPALVSGVVSPASATLMVEGMPVTPAEDGSFSIEIPVDGAYRNIDVDAAYDSLETSARVPVFSGQNPLDTWPGGATFRLLPNGLTALGEMLGETIDSTGWLDQVDSMLPGFEEDWISIVPLGMSYSPTVVDLAPATDGLDARFVLNDLAINYELILDWASYTTTMTVGFGEIAIGGRLIPFVDDNSMIMLEFTEAQLDLNDLEFDLGFVDGWLVELIVDSLSDWIVEPLGELLLDVVLESLGTIELGGPFSFEFDLLGTTLDANLSDVFSDLDGLGAEIGLGLNEPAEFGNDLPAPTVETPFAATAHAALGLHEGLFQLFAGELVLDLLAQDIVLEGTYGELVGAGLTTLPGGEQAPDGDGWCLKLDPGSAYVARMQEGEDRLVTFYMPDLHMTASTIQNGNCEPWMRASLATEFGLEIAEGTQLALDLHIAEGILLDYGADDVDETEVIDGLSAYMGALLGLLGGTFEIDLADLAGMGGEGTEALSGISPAIVGTAPLVDEDGTWIEGLYAISMTLWQ